MTTWLVLAFVFAQDESFLRTAKAMDTGFYPGTSGNMVVRLEKDGQTARAIFKTKDLEHDNFHNEVLAYRLGKAMGLNIPPTVYREIGGELGSLQLWVEGCSTLLEHEGDVPDLHEVRAFDSLIGNGDRTELNLLICEGEPVLIDHSRAFSPPKK